MSPERRADLVTLIDLGSVVSVGITDHCYRLAVHLYEPPDLTDLAEVATPGPKTEAAIEDVREAQRSAAAGVQILEQLRTTLQRHALRFVGQPDDDAGAAPRAVLWSQLRQSIDQLDGLIDQLTAVTLTAAGAGPIRPEGKEARRLFPDLGELVAQLLVGGAGDDSESDA